jgi:uncharacterized protein YeaO (DUF488 family)
MLKETYVRHVETIRQENPEAIFIAVTRGSPRCRYHKWLKTLAPSEQLKDLYKKGMITWNQYIPIFRNEMNNEQSHADMLCVKELAKENDVYLVCFEKEYPCHRFLLMEMIEAI